MAIDDHGFADESHGAHADGIAEFHQFHLKLRDLGVWVAVADRAQACGLLAQDHRCVFRTTEPDTDDRRLTGEAALTERDQAIQIKPFDAFDPVAWEQHPIIGAEQTAFVHGGDVDPVAVRLERVLDLGRVQADVVVVVRAPKRMHAVRPQRHAVGGFGRGAAQSFFERHRPAFDAGFVAHFDVPARHAGIGAHGAAVFFGGLIVFKHRMQNER